MTYSHRIFVLALTALCWLTTGSRVLGQCGQSTWTLSDNCGAIQAQGGLAAGSPTIFCEGQSVTVINTSVPSNQISRTYIDWGDGTPCETFNGFRPSMTHVYDFPNDTCMAVSSNGTIPFTIRLGVEKTCANDQKSFHFTQLPVSVRFLPVARFTATPNPQCVNASVSINNTSCGNDTDPNVSYLWDFGDGTTSTAKNPGIKTYATPGTYTIKLSVTDRCGTSTTSRMVIVRPPATAAAVPSAAAINAGQTVSFTNQCSNALGYNWTVTPSIGVVFVQPTDLSSAEPTIQFNTPGVFTVRLQAAGCGNPEWVTTISVSPGTTPPGLLAGDCWTWQNPLPKGNPLRDVFFVDAQTGWAVGDYGTILKTQNGGATWTAQTSGTTSYLKSVYFSDNQTGWAVGQGGTILKTKNGGVTWTAQTSGAINWLHSVYFSDSQTGWAVGGLGTIRKTQNGGATWTAQSSGTTNRLFSVYFSDSQTGWAVGEGGTILKTQNGGATWTAQNSGTTRDLYSVYFIDSQTGWAVGQGGTILKTQDGGATWTAQSSGTTNWLHSVYFSDSQTGWAVGISGTILKTQDGGATWTAQTSGTTWDLYSVYFIDSQTGWAVGEASTILKTQDGSATWTVQTSGTTNPLFSVYFSDSQTGWAVGGAGTILKTQDGGATWTAQNSGTTNVLYSVYFIDSQTGWAVGQNGTILKTQDGGATWTAQNSGTTRDLYSVYFIDSQTGWAVGRLGTILRTQDGGATWTAQNSSKPNRLESAYFSDSQTGWAVGEHGIIFKTQNGGATWTVQNSGTPNWLYSVYFIDSQTGWAVGDGGTILKYDCSIVSTVQPTEHTLNVTLYPNPASDHIVISNSGPVSLERAALYDAQGRVVYMQALPLLPGANTTIPLPPGLSGLYFMELQSADGQRVIKKVLIFKP